MPIVVKPHPNKLLVKFEEFFIFAIKRYIPVVIRIMIKVHKLLYSEKTKNC